jgi:hypothetical protein
VSKLVNGDTCPRPTTLGRTSLSAWAREVFGWPKRCEILQHSYKGLKLARLLAQLGLFLTEGDQEACQEGAPRTPHGRRYAGGQPDPLIVLRIIWCYRQAVHLGKTEVQSEGIGGRSSGTAFLLSGL